MSKLYLLQCDTNELIASFIQQRQKKMNPGSEAFYRAESHFVF